MELHVGTGLSAGGLLVSSCKKLEEGRGVSLFVAYFDILKFSLKQ